jgi:ketosteroid isomerase-like protein
VEASERAIRDLYDARARRDWGAVHALLADEVGWHEPCEEDHSGDFRGRDDVPFGVTPEYSGCSASQAPAP